MGAYSKLFTIFIVSFMSITIMTLILIGLGLIEMNDFGNLEKIMYIVGAAFIGVLSSFKLIKNSFLGDLD